MTEAIVCGIFTLINLGILAISVKCLTEFYKVRELTRGREDDDELAQCDSTHTAWRDIIQCTKTIGHTGEHTCGLYHWS